MTAPPSRTVLVQRQVSSLRRPMSKARMRMEEFWTHHADLYVYFTDGCSALAGANTIVRRPGGRRRIGGNGAMSGPGGMRVANVGFQLCGSLSESLGEGER